MKAKPRLRMLALSLLSVFTFISAMAQAEVKLTIATVDNPHMLAMQKLSYVYEEANPGVTIKWVTLEEGLLRKKVSQDIKNQTGEYDVMTIGMYETPLWGSRGWLYQIEDDENYQASDLLPSVRSALSVQGQLHAVPFYAESSMTMYRSDLVQRAGLNIAGRDSWGHIRDIAAALHNPDQGIYGICLRGKPGWGQNMALVGTIVNAFGGRWFDENWHPQINSGAWLNAIEFYVELLQSYGPENAHDHSFNEILNLFSKGHCGVWVDATIAASYLSNPATSKVAQQVAFAQSPIAVTSRGSNWLWSWALGVPKASREAQEAIKFVKWATSKEYIKLVADKNGWGQVPTGTRFSTYNNPDFQQAVEYAIDELTAIETATPGNSTLLPSPYVGIQIVSIPEFEEIGNFTGEQISLALQGKITVQEALEAANNHADNVMKKAYYY